MIGHSIGEYVAACLAGVFSLEDALALVAERGRLMQSLPPGGMLAVPLGEAALRPHLGPGLDLASLNTPSASVVSGPHEAIARLEEELRARGVTTRALHTSHAFHSAMMDPILEAFRERVAAVERRRAGHPVRLERHRRLDHRGRRPATPRTGRATCARRCASPTACGGSRERGNPVLLEVGPGDTLAALVRQQGADDEVAAIATLRHPKETAADRAVLLGALGRLWLAGAPIDWARVHAGDATAAGAAADLSLRARALLGRVEPGVARRLRRGPRATRSSGRRSRTGSTSSPGVATCRPSWPPGKRAAAAAAWLVFLDDGGLGAVRGRRAARGRARGHDGAAGSGLRVARRRRLRDRARSARRLRSPARGGGPARARRARLERLSRGRAPALRAARRRSRSGVS